MVLFPWLRRATRDLPKVLELSATGLPAQWQGASLGQYVIQVCYCPYWSYTTINWGMKDILDCMVGKNKEYSFKGTGTGLRELDKKKYSSCG